MPRSEKNGNPVHQATYNISSSHLETLAKPEVQLLATVNLPRQCNKNQVRSNKYVRVSQANIVWYVELLITIVVELLPFKPNLLPFVLVLFFGPEFPYKNL